MNEKSDLTTGPVGKTLLRFAMPYLLACFLQTFYGMVDLFVVGLYNGAATTTAVSIGSQIMHMLTVIIAGFAMGVTVRIGRMVGAKEKQGAEETIGTAVAFFLLLGFVLTIVLLFLVKPITTVMMTPPEAVSETVRYLQICFLGTPFIVIYNVVSGMFRGAGDSRRPLYFVAAACVTNIILDFVFVGGFHLGAAGAALATVLGQATSSVMAVYKMLRSDTNLRVPMKQIRIKGNVLREVLFIGGPIALQDGLIQVSFIVITVIANSRGLIAATSVGIVEKLIGFMFLVPSAFLSAISAITAQNMGAGKPKRARQTLGVGLLITVSYGFVVALYNQFLPETLVGLFTRDALVLAAGCAYLRSYVWDVMFAAIHFCFSGYFCGEQKSVLSFIHNMIAIVCIRVPGAYLASVYFPGSLYPMGWAAPAGSLFSAIICVIFYLYFGKIKHKEI